MIWSRSSPLLEPRDDVARAAPQVGHPRLDAVEDVHGASLGLTRGGVGRVPAKHLTMHGPEVDGGHGDRPVLVEHDPSQRPALLRCGGGGGGHRPPATACGEVDGVVWWGYAPVWWWWADLREREVVVWWWWADLWEGGAVVVVGSPPLGFGGRCGWVICFLLMIPIVGLK
jgi:hypothetical protein